MSAHTRPSYCTHLRAAGQLLAAAGAAARQLARDWQPCTEIQKSRHMAGSHVRVIRFSTVRAHPESGYSSTCIRGTPVPGLGSATPGRVILTLRPPARTYCIFGYGKITDVGTVSFR